MNAYDDRLEMLEPGSYKAAFLQVSVETVSAIEQVRVLQHTGTTPPVL